MSYEPLHHKYRPQTFAQLVGQEAIATTLTNALRQGRIAPAYLFTGARGTGKTSSARILAKSLNCLKYDTPTESPCGVCEVCRAIARGTALDVIEIDAASNTGVDNIRELIERAQFAPVQCRYKVYVVDECLTGDSLVTTSQGLVRIDDPNLKGKCVLSYNELSGTWEFKKVVRWLDRGERQILTIQTASCKIACTKNHLLRTETGWIAAGNVKEGMRILSPVSVDVALKSLSSEQMDACADLFEGINLKATNMDREPTTCPSFLSRLKYSVLSAVAGVARNLPFPSFYSTKEKGLEVFSPIGRDIPTKKVTGFGYTEQKNSSQNLRTCGPMTWGLSTEPRLEMALLPTQTNTVVSPDLPGLTVSNKLSGWNIRQRGYQNYDQSSQEWSTRDMGNSPSAATLSATPNLPLSLKRLRQEDILKQFLVNGSNKLLQKGLLGGTWMMAPCTLVLKEAHKSSYTQKDTLKTKTNSWLVGLQRWVTQLKQDFSEKGNTPKSFSTSGWEQTQLENGCSILSSMRSQQWHTNLEVVESVLPGGVEQVYDLEVEDNHNFVANGLLVHNCHMLSTAAFNALLKTLEEPPDRIVFVLATTDPQKVLPTIISRCQRFDFRRIPLDAMVAHLGAIAQQEQIPITEEALTLVAQISQGGLRDAESLLDQLSLLSGEVSVDRVWDLVGAVPERDLMSLLEAIAADDAETVLDLTRRLLDRGREPLIVLQNLASLYRDLLIAKTAPDRNDLVALTAPTWQRLGEFAQTLDVKLILSGQQHLRQSEVQIKNTSQPRLWLEVTLLGLLPSAIGQPAIAAPPVAPRQSAPVRDPAPQSPPRQRVEPAPMPSVPKAAVPESLPRETVAPVPPPPPVEEAAVATAAQATPATPKEVLDLVAIWKQIIQNTAPPGTQALLRQQGHLLAFDGQEARIGVSSQQLFKMFQERRPNVEAAFQRVLNREVKVRLEVTTLAPAPAISAPTIAPPPPIPTPTPVPNPAPAPEPSAPPAEPPTSRQTRKGTPPSSSSPEAAIAPPESPPPSWQEDEASFAAKRLAEFFGGKVVNLEEENEGTPSHFPEALPELSPSPSTSVPSVVTDWNAEDADEEDLPF